MDPNSSAPVDALHVENPGPSSSVEGGGGGGGGGGTRGKCFGRRGRLTWGAAAASGRMAEMEDAHAVAPDFLSISCGNAGGCSAAGEGGQVCEVELRFFGVYDGHGGSQVGQYCVSRMHEAVKEEWENNEELLSWQKRWEVAFERGIARVDDELISNCVAPDVVGSTAVVAVVSGCQIICANCGDSRAVLCQRGQPLPLTIDHKPDRQDELARIESIGGRVVNWGGARVQGILAMSRAVGDRYLRPWVIANPEVTFHARSEDDDCLILASDGLWDVVSNEEACDVAYRILRKFRRNSGLIADGTQIPAQAIADYLLNLAYRKQSSDNISVVVVDLKVRNRRRPKQ
ncbi:protein phosphatase 2C [Carex littledalei]|uniref:protein-serine/threonine phosphatase n=1 Tax=Carex littledalei TaxID=544730 RepID=A0A833VZ94_9POAL|nr:protein phosphatase 2C [Carex littledalei]